MLLLVAGPSQPASAARLSAARRSGCVAITTVLIYWGAMAIANAFPELQRELDFIPLGVDNPKVLTREQIAHYNEFGYVAPISVFSENEIAEIRAYFDELLPRAMEAGWGQYVSSRVAVQGCSHPSLSILCALYCWQTSVEMGSLVVAGAHELA